MPRLRDTTRVNACTRVKRFTGSASRPLRWERRHPACSLCQCLNDQVIECC